MTITVNAYTPNFVAEIYDVDLSKPVSVEDMSAIKRVFWKYGVLVFPEQKLSAQNHVDFAQQFGPIEMDRVLAIENAAPRLGTAFADISNLNREGKIWDKDSRQRMYKEGNKLWHTDKPGHCGCWIFWRMHLRRLPRARFCN